MQTSSHHDPAGRLESTHRWLLELVLRMQSDRRLDNVFGYAQTAPPSIGLIPHVSCNLAVIRPRPLTPMQYAPFPPNAHDVTVPEILERVSLTRIRLRTCCPPSAPQASSGSVERHGFGLSLAQARCMKTTVPRIASIAANRGRNRPGLAIDWNVLAAECITRVERSTSGVAAVWWTAY